MNEQYEIKRTQTMVSIALMTALIASITMFVKIPLPYGYLNLGDFVIMVAAVILPFRGAMFAAGIGSAMADLMSGYPQYAIFTLFIKAFEVVIIFLLRKHIDTPKRALPFGMAALMMVVSYATIDAFLVGNIQYFFVSALQNAAQGIISAGMMVLLYPRIKHIKKYL